MNGTCAVVSSRSPLRASFSVDSKRASLPNCIPVVEKERHGAGLREPIACAKVRGGCENHGRVGWSKREIPSR